MSTMSREEALARFQEIQAQLEALGVDLDEDGMDSNEILGKEEARMWGPMAFFVKDPELAAKFEYIYAQMGLGFLDDYEYWQVTNLVSVALEFLKIEHHYHKLAQMLEQKLQSGEVDENEREIVMKKIEKYKRIDLKPLVELVLAPAVSILRVSGSKKGNLPKLMRSTIQEVKQTIRENERESQKRLSFFNWFGGGKD